MAPSFSLISPVLNGENYIARSYWCLRNQGVDDWEWIIVDDGSTDQTVHEVEKLGDERIKLIRLDKNKGRGYARTVALNEACGSWIVVWDIDDIYFPDRLTQALIAKEQGKDFCVSWCIIIDKVFNITGYRRFGLFDDRKTKSFLHPTLSCESSILKKLGYDPTSTAGEDFFAVEIERRVMQDYVEDGLAHAAVSEDDIDALFRLHEAGCDLDVTDSKGRTLVHIAATLNRVGCIYMLSTSGYDIDSTDDDDRTPCHDAAKNGHLDSLQLMADISKFNHLVLTEKDKYGRNVAHEAAEHGHKECLKFILEDPGAFWIRDEQDVYLQTPAHVAALNDNWGCYHLLEEFGCDFELMDDRDYTAAEMVCYKEELRVGDDWFTDRRTSSEYYSH